MDIGTCDEGHHQLPLLCALTVKRGGSLVTGLCFPVLNRVAACINWM